MDKTESTDKKLHLLFVSRGMIHSMASFSFPFKASRGQCETRAGRALEGWIVTTCPKEVDFISLALSFVIVYMHIFFQVGRLQKNKFEQNRNGRLSRIQLGVVRLTNRSLRLVRVSARSLRGGMVEIIRLHAEESLRSLTRLRNFTPLPP